MVPPTLELVSTWMGELKSVSPLNSRSPATCMLFLSLLYRIWYFDKPPKGQLYIFRTIQIRLSNLICVLHHCIVIAARGEGLEKGFFVIVYARSCDHIKLWRSCPPKIGPLNFAAARLLTVSLNIRSSMSCPNGLGSPSEYYRTETWCMLVPADMHLRLQCSVSKCQSQCFRPPDYTLEIPSSVVTMGFWVFISFRKRQQSTIKG